MFFRKLGTTIREARESERMAAKLERQEALLEYVAIMTGVELPEESEGNGNE